MFIEVVICVWFKPTWREDLEPKSSMDTGSPMFRYLFSAEVKLNTGAP